MTKRDQKQHCLSEMEVGLDRRDIFRMGEKNFKTIMYKRVPVRIGSHQEDLEVGVMEVKIPLLISKRKLKEWGDIIDFKENVLHLRITNKVIKLDETTTSHLVVRLVKNIKDDKEEIVKELFLIKRKLGQEKRYQLKELKKIHRVYGHPSMDKLKILMKDSELEDPTWCR